MSLGRSVAFPGHPLGSGLTPEAAKVRNIVLKILTWLVNSILANMHAYSRGKEKSFNLIESLFSSCLSGNGFGCWNPCWYFID